jgi:hypothetical protein
VMTSISSNSLSTVVPPLGSVFDGVDDRTSVATRGLGLVSRYDPRMRKDVVSEGGVAH